MFTFIRNARDHQEHQDRRGRGGPADRKGVHGTTGDLSGEDVTEDSSGAER